jgi:hypothetical protein
MTELFHQFELQIIALFVAFFGVQSDTYFVHGHA